MLEQILKTPNKHTCDRTNWVLRAHFAADAEGNVTKSAGSTGWRLRLPVPPALRGIIEAVCRASGYVAPVTCTPIELIEVI